MKNNIILVRPTSDLKEKALAYRKEHFQHGEKIIYGSELFDKTESYEEWLSSVTRNTDPKTVNENWVVTDTFFAVRNSDGRIVGIIDLRHTLNDFLKDLGNCGYSVRPSERKKGYATEEDKLYHIHKWAMLFKATTWEEIEMIAEENEYLKEASKTMFRMSADDLIRKRCRDREEYYQDLRNYERVIAEKDRKYEQAVAEIERLRSEVERLRKS